MKKFSFLQIIILSLFIFLLLGSDVQAVKNIEWAEADQLYVFVGTPAQITITAKIAEDPALIPTGVNLYKYDSNNKPIANLGRLYDDATHGDLLADDNRFTTQITFNEIVPGELRFKVTVAYKGTLQRLQSDVIVLQTKIKADPEEIRAGFINTIRVGNTEDIISYLAPGKKDEEFVLSLTPEQKNQFADWVQVAQIIKEIGDKRYYQYSIPNEGVVEFQMVINPEGNWVFIL